MKIRTVVLTAVAASVFTISGGLSLSTVAVAEPFNSRGQDFVATAQSDVDTVGSTVTITDSGFNDRGQNFIVEAPAGSPAQKPIISLSDKTVHGWNS